MDGADDFQPDLAALLVPVAGELPAGPSLRYDPQYMAIRLAREEEDPRLPMREWERPLKKADWPLVADNATAILRGRSKDFQVAAWLCEAWIHLYELQGFHAAITLVSGLIDQYWDTAHPQIEADDDEARIAPLYWMNENLPRVLMLNVPLMHLPERMPSAVNIFDWEQALALENRKPESKKSAQAKGVVDSPIPTRSEIVAGANGPQLQLLIDNRNSLLASLASWGGFTRALDAKMGMQAPSVAKVPELLQRMLRMCDTLIAGREPKPTAVVVPSPASPPEMELVAPARADLPIADVPVTENPVVHPPSSAESDIAMGPIANREDAYRSLEAVAEYLQRTEPHSPTPYLIKRAVTWGRMSLADLMQEIVREEGDIARYFSLLGIKETRD
jgi:type VI secretion system protein ImpA